MNTSSNRCHSSRGTFSRPREIGRPWHSLWTTVGLLIATSTSIRSFAAEKSALDPWWTNAAIVRISILLPAEAIRSLAKDPRQNVTGSMREGAIAYDGVKVHLKG